MRLRRIGTILSTVALTMLTVPAGDAHATAIACGGGVSTGRVAVNGCISAERHSVEGVPYREVTAHVKLRNTGTRALTVSYEAFWLYDGSTWRKIGSGRTNVAPGATVGPVEVGSKSLICGGKAQIRVHAQAAGAAWSGWSPAATSQCQT
ncbi:MULTISPECIES: hypothetical protein [unclassified Streptomyces]|uniref:hypothetical protein n=1 Tax=unclassified Streptomyces TaxID=2593676 RepID=UPI00081EEBC1|nr:MULTISPECIES: hypothetical protein [unclassified Streptomyces]MYZ34590.1 hypothetical protein [Streptomyces sp. SID4917]SCF68480.1 hypothetical protein GA0115259_1009823 [Streptomyces sp. MnatMP-M17]